ncbi:MAG: PilZ domain-containing protein [Gammaproteobacteria bacterium]|nr:PilZ domain-containing protein [Gammaproteobacteria bacterium]NNF60377.1 PilZ domain-containing protein [Gammaproteobacteria bacterium]
MSDRRRDSRIEVELPFTLRDDAGNEWRCRTLDVSPTGLQLEVDGDQHPAVGTEVTVAVQGAAEEDWEHINARCMRVVRQQGQQISLTYTD